MQSRVKRVQKRCSISVSIYVCACTYVSKFNWYIYICMHISTDYIHSLKRCSIYLLFRIYIVWTYVCQHRTIPSRLCRRLRRCSIYIYTYACTYVYIYIYTLHIYIYEYSASKSKEKTERVLHIYMCICVYAFVYMFYVYVDY